MKESSALFRRGAEQHFDTLIRESLAPCSFFLLQKSVVFYYQRISSCCVIHYYALLSCLSFESSIAYSKLIIAIKLLENVAKTIPCLRN